MLPVHQPGAPVWGEGERPNWLAPDELQPKKRDWSPARDRLEAELELKARLQEQHRLRRQNSFRFLFLPFIWTWSLLVALVEVGRNRPDPVEVPVAPATSHGAASLDTLPSARPFTPAEDRAAGPSIGWAPPPSEVEEGTSEPAAYETPESAREADAEQAVEHPEVHWPDEVAPAPDTRAPGPTAPHKDWRPLAPPPGSEAARQAEDKPPPAEIEPPPLVWGTEPPPVSEPYVAEPPVAEEAPAAEPPAAEAPAGPLTGWEPLPELEGAAPAEAAAPAPEAPAPEAPAPEPPAPETPVELPTSELPKAAPPTPLPTVHVVPTAMEADELVRVVLGTCMRAGGGEVGVLALLQDDVMVVRASSGVEPETAARLALETLGDLCLDVIGSGHAFRHHEANPGPPDPFHPRAVLCAPVMLAGAGIGAVLLAGYAPGRQFTAEQERLVSSLAEKSGTVLANAGAFQLPLDRPGDRWRRLDQVGAEPAAATAPVPEAEPSVPAHKTGEIVGSPLSTMTLDPAAMRRLIAEAQAARLAQEAEAARLAQAEDATRAAAEAAAAAAAAAPALEEEPAGWRSVPDWAPPPAAEPVPTEEMLPTQVLAPTPAEAPAKPRHQAGWRTRVGSRMKQASQRKAEDRTRYRMEILAAVRNLSWDGYQALIADIFRRKAFEVFPPPVSGSDLDVIDLVVDRDGERMLINCQLRGEMDIPAAAASEMGNVVNNYSVAGAYLIADGSFSADAAEAAAANGVVLIDGEALIDLVIETTLKDESKPSVVGRLAKRFSRAS